MSDLISREDTATELKSEIYEICEHSPGSRDYGEGYNDAIRKAIWVVENWMPTEQRQIIYCKDCKKHNKDWGIVKDCCPLIWVRGKAQGHEFDYQYCAFAKRKEDE